MMSSPRRIADPILRRRVVLAVTLILLVSAGLRLWQLGTPPDLMFDEVYYAKDAKAIVDGRVKPEPPLRWEAGDEVSWPHPEMGKFAIATGILVFGDRSFGWRLPAVVAGMVLLACVYPLARRLGLSPPWAVMALLLAAADPLGITQSRIATLDIFIAAWTGLCILFALRYAQDGWRLPWVFLCGAAGGMALATKWSGALALIAAALIILFLWIAQRRGAPALRGDADAAQDVDPEAEPAAATAAARARDDSTAAGGLPGTAPAGEAAPAESPAGDAAPTAPRWPAPASRWAALVAALVLVPVLVYVVSYAQYFGSGHTLADWWELHRQMATFSLNLKATHSYASAAPTWIVDYRPVWYYFDGKEVYRGVVAIGNPLLWWLATLSLVAAVVLAVTRRSTALLPAAAVVAVLYLPWFATTRTSFLYYMTPVAPFLAILVASALCLVARGEVPRRGWLALAGAALATALLWRPLGLLARWLFWELPRRAGDSMGWIGVAVGILIVLAAIVALSSPKMKRYRPWMAFVVAGVVVGIVVAFIPVVLALPITPEYFSHITWFPSWI